MINQIRTLQDDIAYSRSRNMSREYSREESESRIKRGLPSNTRLIEYLRRLHRYNRGNWAWQYYLWILMGMILITILNNG